MLYNFFKVNYLYKQTPLSNKLEFYLEKIENEK